jgi:hypothetical protein
MSIILLESLICCLTSFACFCTFCRVKKSPSREYYHNTNIDSTNRFSYNLYPKYSVNNSPILVGEDLSESSIECSICLEKYILNEEIHMLMCGHYYHSCCYKNWSEKGKLSLADERCPICQTVIYN